MYVAITKLVTKEVEETIESYTECDGCKVTIPEDLFDAYDFTLTIREGQIYPSGGFGTVKTMDLCKECSATLVKAIKLVGFNLRETEWNT